MNRLELIIFDMDGLMFDTEKISFFRGRKRPKTIVMK